MYCNISNTSFVLQEHKVQQVHQVLFLVFQTCSFKLIFFIYILFNFNIAQVSSNKIWVRHNDQQPFSFDQDILECLRISNVGHLIGAIKPSLENSIENVSEKVITLFRGDDKISSSNTLISGLYNQKDEALEVLVEGKIGLEHLSLCLIFVFKLNMIWLIMIMIVIIHSSTDQADLEEGR